LRLQGFNNLTKSLSFNIYDICYAASEDQRQRYIEYIDEVYNAERLTQILTEVANIIGANILNVARQDYDPQGASVTILISEEPVIDKKAAGKELISDAVVAHLDQSHITVHTYPETHPQARNYRDDLMNFKRKADAGANAAITQYFFNPDAYFNFVDDCAKMGVSLPIVPGIMPISNFSQLSRFSAACGAEVPRWLTNKMESYMDDTASIKAFGLDFVTGMCDKLLRGGAPGLHFYTLNQAGLTSAIWQRLGL
jgi:methylenetetrahydrofolate reductase (NADPH)